MYGTFHIVLSKHLEYYFYIYVYSAQAVNHKFTPKMMSIMCDIFICLSISHRAWMHLQNQIFPAPSSLDIWVHWNT